MMDRGLAVKVPSSSTQGMRDEEEEVEEEDVHISVETCPHFWYLSFPVKPSYTIRRLILKMENSHSSSRAWTSMDNDLVEHVRSLDRTGMILFQGNNLLEHPDRTLQQWGVKDGDTLIIRDKRPFLVSISMHRKESVEVELEVHDTVSILKDKIQNIAGIPAENQMLCFLDSDGRKHVAVADDSVSLQDYGIMKIWDYYQRSREIKHQIWLYTDKNPQLDLGHFSPIHVTGASSTYLSSWMEIGIQFCRRDQFLRIAVQSYYTVNQVIKMIRESKRSEKIYMLVFQCKNLLEHGSSTLGDLGIKDQDKLLIPAEGAFSIVITISPSSFGQQQQETRRADLQFDVEASWTVLALKEKIKSYRNIPVKKQRLCYVGEGVDAEKCHLVMHDSINLAAYGIMQTGHCIGLYYEDDQLIEEDGAEPSKRLIFQAQAKV